MRMFNYLNRVRMQLAAVVAVIGMTLQLGCGNETFLPTVDCSDITFSEDISPIIDASCAITDCHVPNNPPRVDFTRFDHIQEEAEEMRKWMVNRTMPPADAEPITSEEAEQIICWIDGGALEN